MGEQFELLVIGGIAMILLKMGNQGPSVVVLQVILNAVGRQPIKIDGIFGEKTRKAVRDFQTTHSLNPDGIVGKKTWPELARLAKVVIADVVDAEDPAALTWEVASIRAAGGHPIILYGMSNGVAEATARVRSTYPANSVVILRFHSHGAPGDMNVSAGTGGDSKADLSGISHDNLPLVTPHLQILGRHMASFGCVEFHGCNVGQSGLGHRLLEGVANAMQRPASAGIKTQYPGGPDSYATFCFEGPVVTAYPGGISMRQWAERHHVTQSGPLGTYTTL